MLLVLVLVVCLFSIFRLCQRDNQCKNSPTTHLFSFSLVLSPVLLIFFSFILCSKHFSHHHHHHRFLTSSPPFSKSTQKKSFDQVLQRIKLFNGLPTTLHKRQQSRRQPPTPKLKKGMLHKHYEATLYTNKPTKKQINHSLC